jgi:hypothetical protein
VSLKARQKERKEEEEEEELIRIENKNFLFFLKNK